MNCFLVKMFSGNVLIDIGFGDKFFVKEKC